MTSIGQQIIVARKAKGMTQDALSKALNISRSAVAHWETERTIPDAEMLLKLSKVLDYSFEDESARVPEATPEDDGSPAEGEAEAPQAESVVLSQGRVENPTKRRWIILCAAVAVLLCACLAALLIHKNSSKSVEYRDESGAVYTVEQFQKDAPREDGKAWLMCEKSLKIIPGNKNEVWMYEFTFREMNSIGLDIDLLEVCTFHGENEVLPNIIMGDSLPDYGLSGRIESRGEWKLTGGLQVSDTVQGVGITLNCTDDNGEALSFSDYLKLNQ